ncbi:MAG TPA: hypothetical protein VK184_12275 [Nostocaceae cyanobacterium]|nr:hypothetical protein [Nostocaceae cyanobacterium]
MFSGFRGTAGNELGEYLPNEEAELQEESERIQANNQQEAKEKCDQVAKEYGGIESKAERIDKNLYDCKFKVWR